MKKQIYPAFALILLSLLFTIPVQSQDRNNVINRLSLISELRISDDMGYIYDGVIVFMRTVDNKKRNGDETYDALGYKCFAEARFFKDGKNYRAVDSVVINNVSLEKQPFGTAGYYLTSDKYIHGVQTLSPKVNIKVYGDELETVLTDSALSMLKFPDFYYIEDYTPAAQINGQSDWSIKVTKWMNGAGFSLPQPDMLRAWVLSKATAPHSSLANFQPVIKSDNVNAPNYSGLVESKYNIFDNRVCLPGQGCAVVRTYKSYMLNVPNLRKGTTETWNIVMAVETEVPVDFQ